MATWVLMPRPCEAAPVLSTLVQVLLLWWGVAISSAEVLVTQFAEIRQDTPRYAEIRRDTAVVVVGRRDLVDGGAKRADTEDARHVSRVHVRAPARPAVPRA